MTSSRKVDPLSNSKKISKANSESSNLSKYNIFDTKTKNKVLTDLRREIIKYFKLLLTEDKIFGDELIKKIDQFPLTDYNRALLQILKKHGVDIENNTKSLTSWRKKIKAWIKADGKPETRGGLVIPVKYQLIFKARVDEILDGLPFRSLPLLREKILNVLKEILQTDDIDEKTCSKHWWFNYMRKNSDIKTKWEKILLERTTVKNSKNGSKKLQDLESTDDDENSVSQSQDQVSQDVSSPSLFLADQEENALQNLEERGGGFLNYSILGIEEEEIPKISFYPQRVFESDLIVEDLCPSPSGFFYNSNDESFKFERYHQDDEISFPEF